MSLMRGASRERSYVSNMNDTKNGIASRVSSG